MRRWYLFITGISCILFFSACFFNLKHKVKNQGPITGWDEDGLKEKVKYVVKKSYKFNDSSATPAEPILTEADSILFDSAGHEKAYYNFEEKNLSGRGIYTYDNKGHKLTFTSYDSAGKPEEREVYEYDSKGNMSKAILYNDSGKILSARDYKYDLQNNNIERIIRINDSAHSISRFVSKFDMYGNEVKQEHTYKGKFRYAWKEVYDRDNNKNVHLRMDSLENILAITSYFYDHAGHLIKMWSCSLEGNDVYNTSYIFNAKGEEKEEIDSSGRKEEERTKLDYDSAGNWVRSESYANNAPYSLEERKIEYYK